MSQQDKYEIQDGSQEEKEKLTTESSRRRMLKSAGVLGGSALIFPGLASASTADEMPSDDSPDWLIIGEENEAEIVAGEIKQLPQTETGQATPQDHNDKHLKLDTTVNAFGFSIGIVFEHWAGSCKWKSHFKVQGQTATTGRQRDCWAKYGLDLDFGVVRMNGSITSVPLYDRRGMKTVNYSGEIEAYDPTHGWRSQSFDFTFDIPITVLPPITPGPFSADK